MPRDENMIAALKRERAAYLANGNDDGVAQVDEQLRHYGYNPDGDSQPQDSAPQGRTAPPQQTADTGARAERKPPAKKTAASAKKATAAEKTAPPQE